MRKVGKQHEGQRHPHRPKAAGPSAHGRGPGWWASGGKEDASGPRRHRLRMETRRGSPNTHRSENLLAPNAHAGLDIHEDGGLHVVAGHADGRVQPPAITTSNNNRPKLVTTQQTPQSPGGVSGHRPPHLQHPLPHRQQGIYNYPATTQHKEPMGSPSRGGLGPQGTSAGRNKTTQEAQAAGM